MNIDYSYLKKRGQFGSQYAFISDGPNTVENLQPDKNLGERYILRNPVDKSTQETPQLSVDEANTWRADFTDRGMFHDQGGWPKDLNILDEEAVLRFRKKLEREDNYVASMRVLTKPIEHAILQNNAINIYQKYFESAAVGRTADESLTQIRNVYRYPRASEGSRPVSRVSWANDNAAFAASYCDARFELPSVLESTEAYIWDVEIPSVPQTVLDSKIPILNLEWNPMDRNLLVAGMHTGQVACYDIRKPPEHVEICPKQVGHRDPVHSVLWINSKTGVEFFTTSADGAVKWWDCRYLDKYTDFMIMDLTKNQNMAKAYGSSCLEYDPSVPSKYLVGTDTGHVICGNRKGTIIAEKLAWVLKAHSGPVYSVMRNPGFTKVIMTMGDWNIRIWSEDCKESAIMWTKNYNMYITSGEWSRGRHSVFTTIRSDGFLDVWDMLLDQREPFVSVRVTDKCLTTLRMEERGQFLVVGDQTGKCHFVQFGDSLATSVKNDRNNLSAMFDRESRREKILEGRMREIRLANKMKAQLAEEAKEALLKMESEPTEESTPVEVIQAEEMYWEELRKAMELAKQAGKKKEPEEERGDDDDDDDDVEQTDADDAEPPYQ